MHPETKTAIQSHPELSLQILRAREEVRLREMPPIVDKKSF